MAKFRQHIKYVRSETKTNKVNLQIPAIFFAVLLIAIISGCTSNMRTGEVEINGIVKFYLPAFPETGVNKVQIFNEMHYQPSYGSQEVPRLMPHSESVPFVASGDPNVIIDASLIIKELTYQSLDEYRELDIPERFAQSYDHEKIQEIYRVNCLMCHGSTLQGDGPVKEKMTRGPYPANLTTELTKDSANGELFAFISEGGRQGYAAIESGRESRSPMPAFKFMLSEEERWGVVQYMRSFHAAK